MNEINLKEFEFDKKLLENVELFDKVLKELNEPPLFENQNFEIVTDFRVYSNSLVMQNIDNKGNTLPIIIFFEAEDLRIDIDFIPETYDWAKKQIEEDGNSVIELIRSLFTGYVLIETRGASRFIQIFDSDGFFVNAFSRNNSLHFFTGLYLFRYGNFRRLYLPMFSVKK